MRSLDIRIIRNCINQTQSVYLPEFSEILDISFDASEVASLDINILYQYDYELAGTNQKIFNIWMMDSKNIYTPPNEFYKFFGSIEKKSSEVNLANSYNGRVIPIDIITKYYIFVEEIKTVAETREEKLNDII